MALIPPGLPQARNELPGGLLVFFENGYSEALSTNRRDSNKALMPFETTRTAWSLSRLLNFDSTNDYGLFTSIWKHIQGPEEELGTYFSKQRSLLRNIECHKEKAEDQPLEKIQNSERDYFRNDILKSSIARSLTIVSQWKSQYTSCHCQRFQRGFFVVDSKLWNWILKVIQEREES